MRGPIDVQKRTKAERRAQRKCKHQREACTLRFADGSLHSSMTCVLCGQNKFIPWQGPGLRPNRDPDEAQTAAVQAMESVLEFVWRRYDRCTPKQQEFIDSVSDQFEKRRWISHKQIAVLTSIGQGAEKQESHK